MAHEKGALGRIRDWAFGERSEGAVAFEDVLAAELEDIGQSRRQRRQPQPADGVDPVRRARDSKLWGLALSGGGIRSATFCLGVIQALASADLLKRFDYMSTVSGGGYIGGWLTAWIKRSRRGVWTVQHELKQAASGGKAAPLDFIRDYSNYLAPRTGLFTTDSWTIGSIWLRNTTLNQAVLILFFALCLLIPRLLGLALPWVARFPLPGWIPHPIRDYAPALPAAAAALLLIAAVWRISKNLLWFESPQEAGARKDPQSGMIWLSLALLAASWLGAAAVWQARVNPITPWVSGAIFAGGVFWLGWASGFDTCFRRTVGDDKGDLWPWALSMTAVGSGLAGAGLTMAVGSIFESWSKQGPAAGWHVAVWGAPLLLMLMTCVAVVQIGLMGSWLPDDRREWWSRLGAWMFILITSCIVVACLSIYGPLWTAQLFDELPKLSKGLTLGWIFTTIGGVMAGQSGRSGGKTTAAESAAKSNKITEWIAKATPYIAIPGVLLAVSTVLNLVLAAGFCQGCMAVPYPPAGVTTKTSQLDLSGKLPAGDLTLGLSIPVNGVVTEYATAPLTLDNGVEAACLYRDGFFPGWRFLRYQHWSLLGPMRYTKAEPVWRDHADYWKVAWLAFAVLAAFTSFLAWRVDVNEFSLHHFYKNRLVRCYLGASNPGRENKANPFTGFSIDDDVLLAALRPAHGYVGPYPIVNGALNVTHGERLAWQERKAAAFLFTPQYCGFDAALLRAKASGEMEANAYRRTDVYAYPVERGVGGIHLGTTMAISGAAASPNMGYHTSAPVAFLLTLFNVRLGWWLGNPRHARKWRRSGPAVGLLYLLTELFGSATASSDYVYISDGGHFDNLGIYELARRRCRLIVACDSEEDRNFTFGGLGNAIRKCRSDLGVDIDVDLRPLLARDKAGRTSTHMVYGTIDYHDNHPPGVLLYIKSSLIKPRLHEEPADVLEYSMRVEGFPHQTTGDQFFDESQFESYRRLGQHIGDDAIGTLRTSGII